MTFETRDQFLAYLGTAWDTHGACRSCGWHGLIYEHDPDMPDDEDYRRGYVDFHCVSDDDEDADMHRGVRIPLPKEAT